jgi:pimeloyl-ACP methyl ester carboxylesterase
MSALSEAAPPTERTISVGGCRIWYREAGEGQPLVHLHGAGGPAWDEAHAILATRFRVIGPALPGFGESSTTPEMDNLPALADVAAAFIRAVVGDKAHVMGSSFGGRVATWLALRHPDIVNRLVLESPASFRGLAPAPVLPAAPPAGERGLEQYADPQARTRNTAAIAELTRKNPPEEELLARLREIQASTLVLFGTEDRQVPPESGRLYKERMPDCNFALVYRAGHVIRRDRPDAFTRLVTDFLDRGPAFLVNRG